MKETEREGEENIGESRRGREGKVIGERQKKLWERGAEDKGDDDYDDDGTAGYDKFSRFTPACKFLEVEEIRARALTDEIDQNQYLAKREKEREERRELETEGGEKTQENYSNLLPLSVSVFLSPSLG